MTIGNYQRVYKYDSNSIPANFVYRNWNGVDGRYEYVGAVKRVKWNAYSSNLQVADWPIVDFGYGQYVLLGGGNRPSAALDNNDYIQLLSKLDNKVRGSSFNLGVFLGELPESLRMISSNVVGLARSIHALRRGNFHAAVDALRVTELPFREFRNRHGIPQPHIRVQDRSPAGFLRMELPQRYLELQFGWKPLLSDIAAAWQMAENRLLLPRRQYFRASIQNTKGYESSVSPSVYKMPGTLKHKKTVILELSEDISNLYTLGLTSPEQIAWELLPFSFVYDWVMPIGNFLQARAFTSAFRGRTLETEVRSYAEAYGGPVSGISNEWRYKGLHGASRTTYISRGVSDRLSPPLPQFQDLGHVFTQTHIFESLALLKQAFHR